MIAVIRPPGRGLKLINRPKLQFHVHIGFLGIKGQLSATVSEV